MYSPVYVIVDSVRNLSRSTRRNATPYVRVHSPSLPLYVDHHVQIVCQIQPVCFDGARLLLDLKAGRGKISKKTFCGAASVALEPLYRYSNSYHQENRDGGGYRPLHLDWVVTLGCGTDIDAQYPLQ
jgi:hypothetical protein